MGPMRPKKMNGSQWRESNYFLIPVFICPGLHMLFVDLNDNFSCKETYNLEGRSLIRLVFVWGALWTTNPAALDAYDIRHYHSQTDPAVGTWLCLWCTLPPSFKESTKALIEVKEGGKVHQRDSHVPTAGSGCFRNRLLAYYSY